MNNPYLWDMSGDADPFVQRLETALRGKRAQIRASAARRPGTRWRVGIASIAAAALLVVWFGTAGLGTVAANTAGPDVDGSAAQIGASPAIAGGAQLARDADQPPAVAGSERNTTLEVPGDVDAPPEPSPAADTSESIPGAPATARD